MPEKRDCGNWGKKLHMGRLMSKDCVIYIWCPMSLQPPTYKGTQSFQFSSAQSLSHVWLRDPMDCSMPGLPVHHQLPELPQTHVHQVSDAIQPSHPLSSPSPPLHLSSIFPIIRGLFQWVSSSHQVAKVLSFSFSVSPSNEYSGPTSFRIDGWISLQSKGLSRVFSSTTVQKHQFFGAQLSLWSDSHIHTWLLEKP